MVLPACQPVAQEGSLTPQPVGSSSAASSTPAGKTTTPTPAPLPISTLDVDVSELQGASVVLWHAMDEHAGSELQTLSDEFSASNEWGIQLEVQAFLTYSDLVKQVKQDTGTENLPDLVLAAPEQLAAWQADDAGIIDLNTFVYNPDWGITSETINDFFPAFWNQDVSANQRLGFPAVRTSEVVVYNRTWAHALNFQDPPLTFEEFYEQACAAAKANYADEFYGKGGWFMNTEPTVTLAWMAAFGATNPLAESGYNFYTPENMEAFTYLRKLAEDGCAWNNELPTPEESIEPYVYFADRQTILVSLSVDELPTLAAAMSHAANSDDWVVLPYPTADASGKVVSFGYSFGMLSPDPAGQLAAWLAIRWFSEPEQSSRLAEASGTLPLSASAMQNMDLTPQMEQAVSLIGLSITPPVDPSWVKVQPILRDAIWENTVDYQRIYAIENSPVRTVEEILKEMEALAQEFSR
jgi:ABC-type glycerol-3-phosphate transport system substrate-binding protein